MNFDPDAFLADNSVSHTDEFDPDSFLAEQNQSTTATTQAFDPDAFLAEGDQTHPASTQAFDPDAFLQEDSKTVIPTFQPANETAHIRRRALEIFEQDNGRPATETERAKIYQMDAESRGDAGTAIKLSRDRANIDVATRNETTANSEVSAVRAPYLAVRGTMGGITLGISDIALRQIEDSVIGKPIQAETMGEAVGENVGRLLGSIFTGAGIAGGMAKSGTGTLVKASDLSGGLTALIAKTGARPFAQLIATRATTSLATMAPQQAASVINGDIPIADAIRDTAINALGSIVGVGPEIFVKPGMANFLAQVTGQVAFDAATDATLTGRLTKETSAEWMINEIPNIATAIIFGAKDLTDKDFGAYQGKYRKDSIDMFARKVKEQIQAKPFEYGPDVESTGAAASLKVNQDQTVNDNYPLDTTEGVQRAIVELNLKPELQALHTELESIMLELKGGERIAGRVPVKTERGEIIGWTNTGAAYPGGLGADTLPALKNYLAGKPLTSNQEAQLTKATKYAMEKLSAEAGFDVANQTHVSNEEMTVGDQVKLNGEKYTVKELDPDTGDLTLKDGKLVTLKAGETVLADRDSHLDADGNPAAQRKTENETTPFDPDAFLADETSVAKQPIVETSIDGITAEKTTEGHWELVDADGKRHRLDPNEPADRTLIEDMDPDFAASEVRRIATETAEQLPGAKVHFIDHEADMDEVRTKYGKSVKDIKAEDGTVRGFAVVDSGDYFILTKNMKPEEAAGTVVHEAVGHIGVRGVLGDRIDTVMDGVFSSRGEQDSTIQKIARDYKLDLGKLDDRREAAEELIAYVAERRDKDPGAWKRLVAKIKDSFRKMGFEWAQKWTDDDVLALIHRAKERVSRPQDSVAVDKDIQVRFAKHQTDSNKTQEEMDMAFSRQIDSIKTGKSNTGSSLDLGETPGVMLLTGADPLPLVLPQHVVPKVTTGLHAIKIDELRKLPQYIRDPIAIFKSKQNPDAHVIMTEMKEGSKTVVVAIELNRREGFQEVNSIRSLYGKDDDRTITSWMKEGMLLYRNTKKSLEWLRSRGLYLPKENSIQGSGNRVFTEADVVNSTIRAKRDDSGLTKEDRAQLEKANQQAGQPDPGKTIDARRQKIEAVKARLLANGQEMRGTAERIAGRQQMLNAGIEDRPASARTPLTILDRREQQADMSDIELRQAYDDGDNQYRGLDVAELYNRMEAQYQTAQKTGNVQQEMALREQLGSLVDDIGKRGTDAALFLRFIQEIKGSRPESIVNALDRIWAKSDRRMTETQRNKLTILARDAIRTSRAQSEAEKDMIDFPSQMTIDTYDAAKKENDVNQRVLSQEVGALTPKKLTDMIRALRQGNQLRVTSHETNIASNLIMGVIDWSGQNTAALINKLATFSSGGKISAQVDFISPVNRIRGLGRGLKEGFSVLKNGGSSVDPSKVDQLDMRSFAPLRSWGQAFTSEVQPKMLVSSKTGQIVMTDRFKKLFEATCSPYAELNFRLLQAEDLPGRSSRYDATLRELAKKKGLKDHTLDAFMRVPDRESRAIAMLEADLSTYQQSSKIVSAIENLRRDLREHPVFDWLDAMVIHPQMIYLKTPVNVFITAMKLSNPMLAITSGAIHAHTAKRLTSKAATAEAQGNAMKARSLRGERDMHARRAWNDGIGLAVIGGTMSAVATMLVREGAIQPAVSEDKDKAALDYAIGKPASLNLTAIKRWIATGFTDKTALRPQENDVLRNLSAFGFFGINALAIANKHRKNITEGKDQNENFAAEMLTSSASGEALIGIGNASLDMTVMQGVDSLIKALDRENFDGWMKTYARAVVGGVIPGVMTQITNTQQENIPDMRSKGMAQAFKNAIMSNNPFVDWTELYPSKTDPLGYPVKRTPIGAPTYFYHMLDFTKGQTVGNPTPEWKEIGRLWSATQLPGVLPTVPERSITNNKKTTTLSDREYEEYCSIIGSERRARFAELINESDYKRASDDVKAKYLAKAWDLGYNMAKIKWLENHSPVVKGQPKAEAKAVRTIAPFSRYQKEEDSRMAREIFAR